ncbi:protein of unknown function DUF1573 [Hymenobacter roseosalivarius DSM 11622]|uniref:DUF1573 domain-containing protein n=1 Tax=Hymenobacter roseosalivarius DSM 11622 TaxID=645990 RepID=A0A1W1W5Z6_9BACT|nr:DUF1573 domain-containing protein [Hymenobacter roseosalivarius]SMC00534.1 protein of unknown function DUF1573 [Hymenobacter roseosalivarius DSM 11622]
MRNIASLLFSVALLLLCFSAQAQGVMTFEKELHDFGNVPEGTMATHEFKFKNTGNQPIVIAGVQASCGCTTPDWTKTPVLPGKSGVVKAVYSSAGRPGVFNKTVTVTSNSSTPNTTLTIKGTVVGAEEMKASLTPAQKALAPRLVLDRNTHDFGKMEAGQQPTARFTVKNMGKQDLLLGMITSSCNCVGYKKAPQPIKPGQSAVVEVLYAQRQIGQMTDVATLNSNDVEGTTKLTLKANVVRDLNAASMVKESATAVPFK